VAILKYLTRHTLQPLHGFITAILGISPFDIATKGKTDHLINSIIDLLVNSITLITMKKIMKTTSTTILAALRISQNNCTIADSYTYSMKIAISNCPTMIWKSIHQAWPHLQVIIIPLSPLPHLYFGVLQLLVTSGKRILEN
jgi:hypothetical protein